MKLLTLVFAMVLSVNVFALDVQSKGEVDLECEGSAHNLMRNFKYKQSVEMDDIEEIVDEESSVK
ncbi:MAG: hypothetical protein ACOCUH_02560 [Bacteriovoracia bacterium]